MLGAFRTVPRIESDETLDFIGLPRMPRIITPLGVGAPSRWSRIATSPQTAADRLARYFCFQLSTFSFSGQFRPFPGRFRSISGRIPGHSGLFRPNFCEGREVPTRRFPWPPPACAYHASRFTFHASRFTFHEHLKRELPWLPEEKALPPHTGGKEGGGAAGLC